VAVLARRRALLGIGSLIAMAGLFGLLGHRAAHAARNLLVPGAGLYDHHLALGLAFTAAAVAATVAWLRWGADAVPIAVVAASAAVSAAVATGAHHDHETVGLAAVPAAHEFPLVVLVAAAIGWIRLSAARLGIGARRTGNGPRGLAAAPGCTPVVRARIATLTTLARVEPVPGLDLAVRAPDVIRRARLIGLVARARLGGDPLRRDHAHTRAALACTGGLDPDALARFAADAGRSPLGVPCSEPGWIRLLDGTLAALVLDRSGHPEVGHRWAAALTGALRCRRGHRPAWWWTPLGLPVSHALPWEHLAATGLARAAGWIGDDHDWSVLRRTTLGAAARGGRRPADERLVAAGRIWLSLVDDPEAAAILRRPTIGRDPTAAALDAVATLLQRTPDALATPHSISPSSTGGPP
jgi:hypothetical protein